MLSQAPNKKPTLENYQKLLSVAKLSALKNELVKAQQTYDLIISRYPYLPEAYEARAAIYLKRKMPLSAIDDYTRIIELSPKNSDALKKRAELKKNLGAEKEAQSDFNDAAIYRKEISAFKKWFQNQFRKYAAQSPLAQTIKISSVIEKCAVTESFLGLEAYYDDKYDLATFYFNKAIDNCSHDFISQTHRGLTHAKNNNIQLALEDFNTAISQFNYARAYWGRADIHLENNSVDHARVDMLSCIKECDENDYSFLDARMRTILNLINKLDPRTDIDKNIGDEEQQNFKETFVTLAEALTQQGDIAGAQINYSIALWLGGEPKHYVARALTNIELGNKDKALYDIEQVEDCLELKDEIAVAKQKWHDKYPAVINSQPITNENPPPNKPSKPAVLFNIHPTKQPKKKPTTKIISLDFEKDMIDVNKTLQDEQAAKEKKQREDEEKKKIKAEKLKAKKQEKLALRQKLNNNKCTPEPETKENIFIEQSSSSSVSTSGFFSLTFTTNSLTELLPEQYELLDIEKEIFTTIKNFNTKQNTNFQTLIVGGSVFDRVLQQLLNKLQTQYQTQPSEQLAEIIARPLFNRIRNNFIIDDIDIVTELPPNIISEIFADKNIRLSKHVDGLAIFTWQNIKIEMKYKPSLTPLYKDANTRDFAPLYFDDSGSLKDPGGFGKYDLTLGRIRTINQAVNSVQEDPIRILRAIYQSTKRNLNIHQPSQIFQQPELLKNIDAGRINAHLTKLFSDGMASQNYIRLKEFKIFNALFPPAITQTMQQDDSWLTAKMAETNNHPQAILYIIYGYFIVNAVMQKKTNTSINDSLKLSTESLYFNAAFNSCQHPRIFFMQLIEEWQNAHLEPSRNAASISAPPAHH